MKSAPKIWIDGKIGRSSKANLFSFHQGLNYGACVYEGIRSYATSEGPAVFRIKEHVDRFFYSAAALHMDLGYSKKEVEKAILDVLRANKIFSGYIRPIAFYSEPKMGINILNSKITFIIFVWPWDDAKSQKPTTLYITKYTRLSPSSVDMKAKIGGYYANSLLGFIDAQKAGYEQPLFLDERGYIAEGAISNVFIVKGKTLYTPMTRNILDGITRDTIISIAKDLNLKVIEKDIKPDFLKTADEVFLTGTGIQLQSVTSIKGYYKLKNESKITNLINEYYHVLAKGKVSKYKKWLTAI